jgi:hypothetical protein
MPTTVGGSPATLLHNGQVLLAGVGGAGSTSAELYNPATGTWAAPGSMTTARSYGSFSATLLQSGEVLFTGGENASLEARASAELYNPATGKWTATGSLVGPLFGFQSVLLPNGDVLALAAGGTTELYNPATGSWSTAAKFADIGQFSVTLLDTGKVLLAGGLAYTPRPTHSVASASLYDPATGTWQATGAMTTPRDEQKAVLLQSGQALVVGGVDIGTPARLSPAPSFTSPSVGSGSAPSQQGFGYGLDQIAARTVTIASRRPLEWPLTWPNFLNDHVSTQTLSAICPCQRQPMTPDTADRHGERSHGQPDLQLYTYGRVGPHRSATPAARHVPLSAVVIEEGDQVERA